MNQSFSAPVISPRSNSAPIEKDPWLAVNLSMFFPGLGQIYAGKPRQGFLWASAQIVLIIFSLLSIFSADGRTDLGLAGLFTAAVLYLANIFHAHRLVYRQRGDRSLEKIPRSRKNPWFAVFASRVLPGLGQLYGDRVVWGIVFLAVSMASLKLDDFFKSLLFLPPVIGAIATYHAYHTFPRDFHPHRYTYRSILALMVGAIFGWGIICNYLPDWLDKKLEWFEIPSESMVPTLQPGDRVFVTESSDYRPKPGDIVVFHTPEIVHKLDPAAGDYFIKRVVGVAGDRIQVHGGTLYRDDRPVEEPYVREVADFELPPLVIPPNSLFVLGDNRPNSFDSREWGFLPADRLVGRAYKIFWPLDRTRSLLR
jgi:signal peptidase I